MNGLAKALLGIALLGQGGGLSMVAAACAGAATHGRLEPTLNALRGLGDFGALLADSVRLVAGGALG